MTETLTTPVTLTPSEFASATGVGRERLRTWERRHGFPQPVRNPGAPRRYDVADVRRVLAVRRAIEQGVGLPEAIEFVTGSDGLGESEFEAHSAPDLVTVLDHAPFAALIVSGPQPLEVVWVNGRLRAVPDGPTVGDDLLRYAPAFAGGPGHCALEALFAGGDSVTWVSHPSWTENYPDATESLAWRLPQEPAGMPLAALVAVPAGAHGNGHSPNDDVGAERQVHRLRGSLDRVHAWTDAIDDATRALRESTGQRAVAEALRRLAMRIGARDAAFARLAGDALISRPSAAGCIEHASVSVSEFPEVEGALRDNAVDWLSEAAAHAFGVPDDSTVAVVPVTAAGEHLGLLLLAFRREVPLGDAERDLLLGFATTIGFALLGEPDRA